jgi:hypothetical protein
VETQKSNWYNKTTIVILLCILFFPVGLYGLWKNQSISKGWKIGVTVIIAIFAIIGFSNSEKKDTAIKGVEKNVVDSTTKILDVNSDILAGTIHKNIDTGGIEWRGTPEEDSMQNYLMDLRHYKQLGIDMACGIQPNQQFFTVAALPIELHSVTNYADVAKIICKDMVIYLRKKGYNMFGIDVYVNISTTYKGETGRVVTSNKGDASYDAYKDTITWEGKEITY